MDGPSVWIDTRAVQEKKETRVKNSFELATESELTRLEQLRLEREKLVKKINDDVEAKVAERMHDFLACLDQYHKNLGYSRAFTKLYLAYEENPTTIKLWGVADEHQDALWTKIKNYMYANGWPKGTVTVSSNLGIFNVYLRPRKDSKKGEKYRVWQLWAGCCEAE